MGAKLNVPYVPQSFPSSCGAAVLSAVYEFYGIVEAEDKIWQRLRKLRPSKDGDFIYTDDLIQDAIGKGFDAYYKRADLSDEKSVRFLLKELKYKNIPTIIVHQFTKEMPQTGHFRIITDVSKKSIYLHDPHPEVGGPSQRWGWRKFLSFWQRSGEEVTGGIYVVIKPK